MNYIYQIGHDVWQRTGHMGRQDWLLVTLCAIIFAYYCTKME